jgi:hypothetical protein
VPARARGQTGPVRWQRTKVPLVTSAPAGREVEIDARRRRYLLTMGIRTTAFVVAYISWRNRLYVVTVIAAALAVVLPYVAVVLANGGPPRRRAERPDYVAAEKLTALPSGAEPAGGGRPDPSPDAGSGAGSRTDADGRPVPVAHPAGAPPGRSEP